MKNKTNAQVQYGIHAKSAKSLEEVVKKAVQKAQQDWEAKNPETAARIAVSAKISTRVKSQQSGKGAVYLAIIDKLCLPNQAERTQAAILEDIQKQHPDTKVYASIWQQELQGWAKRKFQTRINGMMSSAVKINDCKTLAQIKEKICKQNLKKAHVKKFKQEIVISGQEVLIGGRIYPIEKKPAAGKQYAAIRVEVDGKRQWLRVDVLLAALAPDVLS